MTIKREILVNQTPFQSRVAVLENSNLVDFYLERPEHASLVGNVYKGKVMRVLPEMQAAFVDIGLERNAFLHIKNLRVDVRTQQSISAETTKTSRDKIQHILSEGQALLVQVRKDAINNKGALLDTNISLSSSYLVYFPYGEGIQFSHQLDDQDERARLKSALETVLSSQAIAGKFIVRTRAKSVSFEELKTDTESLLQRWQAIKSLFLSKVSTSLLHQEPPMVARLLRDQAVASTDSIWVDDQDTYNSLQTYASTECPALIKCLFHYSDKQPLFTKFAVASAIKEATQREVSLRSGGRLMIDHTEALTVIDVDTASNIGRRSATGLSLETNLEAAQTIAQQLRLRNICGIIVIDFINMERRDDQRQLESELALALATDPVPVQIGKISKLGLIEISRKRTRRTLHDSLYEPCKMCQASGAVKTRPAVATEIASAVLDLDRANPSPSYTIIAHKEMVGYFENQGATTLATTKQIINKPVALKVDLEFKQHQYDIALA